MAPPGTSRSMMAWLPALNSSWLDASERLANAGRQLADDLHGLQAVLDRPDLLSSLAPIAGLHAHLVAAQTDQVHLLAVLAQGLVRETLASLVSDLERYVERRPHASLLSLLSLYTAEHVRLLIVLDNFQRSVRTDRSWTRAAVFAIQLQSSLSDSHQFKLIIDDLNDIIR